jgi:hypothetical protein
MLKPPDEANVRAQRLCFIMTQAYRPRLSGSLRDHHEQSRITIPNPGPHRLSRFLKLLRHQRDWLGDGFLHNHPSGDPTPSQADIHMTKAIIDIAAPLGISVHDHIIVGKNGHASMKGLRLI